MSDLDKPYNPKETEEKIYQIWEKSGFFAPEAHQPRAGNPASQKNFCIIMPPPNANAPSHVGHALGYTIQDILIRYNRMLGKKTLWLPGSDHAGFETQVVFEKKLEKEGRSRFKMEREEFYKEIWDYVQENKHISENAIKRLGASCDWSRNIFTLDPEIVKIVYQTFKQLHDDGLIYRGDRIGNWCSKHQTALSDLETKYEERTEPLYYLKYGPFIIATARPETKFGDKYVVMHPDDKRYQAYKDGQKINLEWINGPITATIVKDPVIDMEFGTGVMTITPWHDPIDFEIAERHKLDKEQIIDKFGRLLPIAGDFVGKKIAEARKEIVEKLKSKDLLEKIEESYKHNVQVCYKCGTVIEPQIIPQWFVAMTKKMADGRPSLRDMALGAIDSGEVKIVTEKFEKIFRHWMENIRDWPISRQIWWGIPIPVKYCSCGEVIIDIEDKITNCPKCKSKEIKPDPDTFDTWFSSGQWPYASIQANDVKNGTKTFKEFYPTQIMETAWDILFFWVARMIMFSYYRTSKPPFEKVLLHGLVRDKDRQKMSKSRGNVVDPLGVIDTYGADALRFALIFSTAAGNDIPLAEDKIKGMKNFCNKLWNISRFILQNINKEDNLGFKKSDSFTLEDTSVIKELGLLKNNEAKLVDIVTTNLENFKLHEAAQALYSSLWHGFADVYIEYSKDKLKNGTEDQKRITKTILFESLIVYLKLLHPFIPFITEEIWARLSVDNKKLLMVGDWPL